MACEFQQQCGNLANCYTLVTYLLTYYWIGVLEICSREQTPTGHVPRDASAMDGRSSARRSASGQVELNYRPTQPPILRGTSGVDGVDEDVEEVAAAVASLGLIQLDTHTHAPDMNWVTL